MNRQTFAMALVVSSIVMAIGVYNLGAARDRAGRQKAAGTICAGLLVIALTAGIAFWSDASWSSVAPLRGKR
ncbi:hypothetical protein [Gluconobacter oxydans]|uniref:hypothetical protein n=1 Tax=Gluconobacter oxydans TaxID=442 RepID=UPI0039E9C2FD